MHTTLTNGYGGPAGAANKTDSARIAQGDNFLARVVPLIMASKATTANDLSDLFRPGLIH